MSANERTETVFECIRGGAEDYLLKPVTRKEVQHMWQHVWRRQQHQNALRVPHFCPEEVSLLKDVAFAAANIAVPGFLGALFIGAGQTCTGMQTCASCNVRVWGSGRSILSNVQLL